MSNDLISWEALVDNIISKCETYEIDGELFYRGRDLSVVISKTPTVFNKEKVIEELKECKYNSANCKKHCEMGTGEYIAFMSEEIAYQVAIEIVEKGGIE